MIIGAMFGLGTDPVTVRLTPLDVMITAAVAGILFVLHWCVRNRTLEEITRRTPWWLKSMALAGMVIGIVILSGEDRAFIYFQF